MEYILAFTVGGLICVIGQIILNTSKLTPAHVLVMFVVLGVVLGGLGLYEPLAEFGGAGATVPISGFGYSLSQGAIEEAKEAGVIGAFTGGLKKNAGGISAVIIFAYIIAIIFDPKTKK